MRIATEQVGRVTVVRLVGRLTIGKGDVLLRETFAEQLRRGSRRFLLDMTQVAYVDSAGVGEIVVCAKRAGQNGGEIKIVMSARGKAREVFLVSSLDRVFEIFTDEDAALAGFSA